MTTKIKIIAGLLIIGAVFSVYRIGRFVFDLAPTKAFIKNAASLPPANQDPDKDGLSNSDESYWNTDPFNADTDGDGFLDGEEVASGHDPLVQGPNDLLGSSNLTQELSRLTLAGLSEGSLKPDNPEFETSITNMTTFIMSEAYVGSKIDVSKIQKVKHSTSSEERYLKDVVPLFIEMILVFEDETIKIIPIMDKIGSTGFVDTSLKEYFQSKHFQLKNILDKGINMTVPENYFDAHTQFLNTVNQLAQINRLVAEGDKDPVKAAIALQKLPDFFKIISDLEDMYEKILD